MVWRSEGVERVGRVNDSGSYYRLSLHLLIRPVPLVTTTALTIGHGTRPPNAVSRLVKYASATVARVSYVLHSTPTQELSINFAP